MTFRNREKEEDSTGFLEKASLTVLPLLALPDAHTPELCGTLVDLEESRTCPVTKGAKRNIGV
jgi:hypothetical protein